MGFKVVGKITSLEQVIDFNSFMGDNYFYNRFIMKANVNLYFRIYSPHYFCKWGRNHSS